MHLHNRAFFFTASFLALASCYFSQKIPSFLRDLVRGLHCFTTNTWVKNFRMTSRKNNDLLFSMLFRATCLNFESPLLGVGEHLLSARFFKEKSWKKRVRLFCYSMLLLFCTHVSIFQKNVSILFCKINFRRKVRYIFTG